MIKSLFLYISVFTTPALLRAAGPAASPQGGLMMLVPWVAIFAIFYFILIRPQQRQAKEHRRMVDNLKRGDRIMTQGGLIGVVQAVKGKTLELKLNETTKVLLMRTHVAEVLAEDPAAVVAELEAK